MNRCLKIKKIPGDTWIALIMLSMFFLMGIVFDIRFLTMVSLFGLLGYSFFKLKTESYFGAMFLVSFFTFLCGRILINWIVGEKSLLTGAFIYGVGPDDKELVTTFILLFVSVIFFVLGVLINRNTSHHTKSTNLYASLWLQKSCFIIFYITIFFELIVSAERFVFLYVGGSYTEYYTSFARILPTVVYKIAELNGPAFFAILAMAPEKKRIKPVLFLYLLDGFIVLLAGQRNQFVRAALIILCYALIRNKWDKKEKWFSKRTLRLLLILTPAFIVALQAWGTIRNGTVFNVDSILSTIQNFFQDQSSTSVVIYKGIELKESFPQNVNYTFSPIVNFFTNNQITKLFFNTVTYAQQSKELALFGNSYGASLTYMYIPHNYSMGIGMGTSYISEVFHDFGWIGIMLINFMYGLILSKLEMYFSKGRNNIWLGMVLLLFADGILYAPRDSAMNFVVNGLNFTVLLFCFIAYVLAEALKRIYNGEGIRKNE